MACRPLAAVVPAALVAGGCAERGVASGPADGPSGAAWVAVWVAAVLAAGVWGALLARPDRHRPAGRLAVLVLAAHAGAVVVGTAVLVGLAIRSGQVADRPPDPELASSLLRVSRLDGDGALFALVVLVVVVLGALLATVLALAARFVRSGDPAERWIAVGVLGVEVLFAGAAAVLLASGSRWTPWVVLALQLPVALAALVTALPAARA